MGGVSVDLTRKVDVKMYVLTRVDCTRREYFSNYFMKIVVFSQLYRPKSATLEIAYDMKIDSLLFILEFPLKEQSAKTIRTYVR